MVVPLLKSYIAYRVFTEIESTIYVEGHQQKHAQESMHIRDLVPYIYIPS